MGYRSEVGLALTEEDYNELMELAKPLFEKYGDDCCCLSDAPEDRFERYSEKYVYLHWNSLKWYEAYEEVRLIEKFLRSHRHSFIRIGENYNDIEFEVNSNYNDCFYDIQYPCCTIKRYDYQDKKTIPSINADTKWLYANMLLHGATPEEFKILYDLDQKYSLGEDIYSHREDFPIKENKQ